MLAPGQLHHTVYTVLPSHKQTNKGGEAPVPCWNVAFHWIQEFLISNTVSKRKKNNKHWVSVSNFSRNAYYADIFNLLFICLSIDNLSGQGKGKQLGWSQSFFASDLDIFTLLLEFWLTAYWLLNIGRRQNLVESSNLPLILHSSAQQCISPGLPENTVSLSHTPNQAFLRTLSCWTRGAAPS